mgnify:FL=1|tara:strand:- start:1948 stop:2301 length:354 start_codon:yes stop_codon:yes gene_type:complete
MKTKNLVQIARRLPKFADWTVEQLTRKIDSAMALRSRHMKAFGEGGEARNFNNDTGRSFPMASIQLSKKETELKEAKALLQPLFTIASAEKQLEALAITAPKVRATKRNATKQAVAS